MANSHHKSRKQLKNLAENRDQKMTTKLTNPERNKKAESLLNVSLDPELHKQVESVPKKEKGLSPGTRLKKAERSHDQ